jgi:hypothetical protein
METDELQPTPVKQKMITKELFQDRLLITLIGGNFILGIFAIIRVLVSTTKYDIDIPVRYTQFGGVDSYVAGDWFTHYNFVVFTVVILLVNTLIALRIYRHRRWVSISILTMQSFVLIFLVVISWAIINTLPVAG